MSFSQKGARSDHDLLLKPLDELPANYMLIEQADVTRCRAWKHSAPTSACSRSTPRAERTTATASPKPVAH